MTGTRTLSVCEHMTRSERYMHFLISFMSRIAITMASTPVKRIKF